MLVQQKTINVINKNIFFIFCQILIIIIHPRLVASIPILESEILCFDEKGITEAH